MSKSSKTIDGGRLLELVQSAVIEPSRAQDIVQKHRESVRASSRTTPGEVEARTVAKRIIDRYSKYAAMTGGASALTGVVPGIGTIIAATGGALADAATCMKLQVDMTMCIAGAFDYDLHDEDTRRLCYLIAAGGALEKFGGDPGFRVASRTGVRKLHDYLEQDTPQETVRDFYVKLGVMFATKTLEKSLPFGFGVVFGGSFNYSLTGYVGKQAIEWCAIDTSKNR
jgi:hypothetical protein